MTGQDAGRRAEELFTIYEAAWPEPTLRREWKTITQTERVMWIAVARCVDAAVAEALKEQDWDGELERLRAIRDRQAEEIERLQAAVKAEEENHYAAREHVEQLKKKVAEACEEAVRVEWTRLTPLWEARMAEAVKERDEFRTKYRDAMAILTEWRNLDKAEEIRKALEARVAEARREERERLAKWGHICILEACCIENGLHALSGRPASAPEGTK